MVEIVCACSCGASMNVQTEFQTASNVDEAFWRLHKGEGHVPLDEDED